MEIADVGGEEDGSGRRDQKSMPMRVDETGHQRAAAAIDDDHVGATVSGKGVEEIFSILLPRTRTLVGAESVELLPSKTRTFWKRVTELEGCGVEGSWA